MAHSAVTTATATTTAAATPVAAGRWPALVTIEQAAAALGISASHVRTLIEEADVMPKKARWRYGREIIDLTPLGNQRRTLRINLAAIAPDMTGG